MEIKEIKGYLGTGVQCKFNISHNVFELNYDRFRGILKGTAKLILRPLSDLTKEIEHNGEKFVPIDRLHLKHEPSDNISIFDFATKVNLGMEDVLFIMDKLYEWHFDIHNLIEKGEAININTLK